MCVGGIRTSTIAMSGLCAATLRDEVVGVAGLADDLVTGVLEQPGDPLAQQHAVLGDHDAHGAVAPDDWVSIRSSKGSPPGWSCLGRTG